LSEADRERCSRKKYCTESSLWGASVWRWPLDELSHFCVAAKRIRQLHLPRTAALGFQKTGATDHNHYCLSTRRRNIESIQAVKKFHSARCILWRRGRHRVDDDRCLLPLKPIHRADSILERLKYASTRRNLRVVGSDNQHLVGSRRSATLIVNPGCFDSRCLAARPPLTNSPEEPASEIWSDWFCRVLYFLTIYGCLALLLVYFLLPETNPHRHQLKVGALLDNYKTVLASSQYS
jgi:hypothetical protein